MPGHELLTYVLIGYTTGHGLLTFACLLLIYIIGGVSFMKFVRRAEGKELLPNYGFWSNLPGYIKCTVPPPPLHFLDDSHLHEIAWTDKKTLRAKNFEPNDS
ncbi:hypothetical protein DPMN_120576 [Dreissena polymorpha]|uniref:Uncharacterized protein n=1 Tax=Dreissena polymorpha TaxID=45954 RepID=A0A9D4GNT5_DREPO|nr:hypothetical protein DPMN_120576 [Dreissena polymorpha]